MVPSQGTAFAESGRARHIRGVGRGCGMRAGVGRGGAAVTPGSARPTGHPLSLGWRGVYVAERRCAGGKPFAAPAQGVLVEAGARSTEPGRQPLESHGLPPPPGLCLARRTPKYPQPCTRHARLTVQTEELRPGGESATCPEGHSARWPGRDWPPGAPRPRPTPPLARALCPLRSGP